MAMRRVGLLSRHLLVAPTAGAAPNAGEEIRQILEALGPAPIETTAKKMVYEFKLAKIPSLQERGYKNLPELVKKIGSLSPSVDEVGSLGPEMDALQVVKALLFYAADALDECHTQTLKLSMSKKFKDTDTMLKADSNYTHAMVHRTEGKILGPEGIDDENPDGLSGFKNAHGWIGRTHEAAKGTAHPLYPKVLAAAKEIAQKTKLGSAGGKFQEVLKGGAAWDPDAFVDFWQAADKASDKESLEYVHKLINAEWKLLLDSCLEKAGITVPQVANASA